MTEISYIKVKTSDLEYIGIPYSLVETLYEEIEATPKYIHCQTDIKNLKSELSEKYKELFDIKHPAK